MPNLNDIMEMVDILETKAVAVVPTRCVAVRNRHSSCCKCVDVCIGDAIEVENNELTVHAGACVACGACIAVCPTEALISIEPMDETLSSDVAAATLAAGQTVVACARMAARQMGDVEKYATVPCLARLQEQLLVELAAHDVDEVVLVDGVCRTCKHRDAIPALEDTLDSTRALLDAVGCSMRITRTSEFPVGVRMDAEEMRHAAGSARREFFTQTGHYAKDVAKSATEKVVTDKLKQLQLQKQEQSLRDKLGVKQGAGKMPTIEAHRNMAILDALSRIGDPVEDEMFTRIFGDIQVDADKCNGCGMCVMFCPTDALRKAVDVHPDKEHRAYMEFQVSDCTQCYLCADACLQKCIEVIPVVNTEELFDFEPRLVEIGVKKKSNKLFGRAR